MLSFIAALYNEENEVESLLNHVAPYVDRIYLVDDGSTDLTQNIVMEWFSAEGTKPYLEYSKILHTGRPETVKQTALLNVPDGDWVVMLDADERFPDGTLAQIREFLDSDTAQLYTHVWFSLEEYIDGVFTKGFAKCRLFRKDSVTFSTGIHQSDQFSGRGATFNWRVIHRKTSEKQIRRETEYLSTYHEMLTNGEITNDDLRWLLSNHYFVKPHG